MLHNIKAACKHCPSCQQMNRVPQQYHALNLHVPSQPLQLVAMDLIGPFTETSAGHKYALTIMDMLTSYLWAIPLHNKSADHVARSFITHFYTHEGSVVWILTDNGTEFKNKLFCEVAKMLDFDHVFTSPYHPQGNGKLEAAHCFLKDCTWKWLQNCPLEWDEILPNTVAAYNFMPNQNSLDIPFFLLRGHDPITPLHKLLGVKRRHLGTDVCHISLEALQRAWALAALNICMAHTSCPEPSITPMGDLHVGDPVMLRNHVRVGFALHFNPQYRIVHFNSDHQVLLVDQYGKCRTANLHDIHYQHPVDHVIHTIPKASAFGHAAKFVYHPDHVPNLHWTLHRPTRHSAKTT